MRATLTPPVKATIDSTSRIGMALV